MKDRFDSSLDDKLRAYMASSGEQIFQLDEERVFRNTREHIEVFSIKRSLIAAVIIILIVSIIAIPQVSLAFTKLFSFIPGVGIVEKSNVTFFIMSPIIREIESDDTHSSAILDSAIFSAGRMNIVITVNGWLMGESGVELEKELYNYADNFALFINGESYDFKSTASAEPGTALSGLNMWIDMDIPVSDDLFEVRITGFSQPLSFNIIACRDYADLDEIGPTDTHNGISIVATAARDGNRLIIRWYSLSNLDNNHDTLYGFGTPIAGLMRPDQWTSEVYIVTESGVICTNTVTSKSPDHFYTFICDLPDGDEAATLHIPYLSLMRHEKRQFTIPVPEKQTAIDCNTTIKCSLGSVKIPKVERMPHPDGGDGEIMRVYFEFTGKDSTAVFSSIDDSSLSLIPPENWLPYHPYGINNDRPVRQNVHPHYNDDGCLDYIDIEFLEGSWKAAKKISFTAGDWGYYYLDEYVIPLDVKG